MRPQKKPRYNDWYTPPGKKDDGLKEELEEVKAMLPDKTVKIIIVTLYFLAIRNKSRKKVTKCISAAPNDCFL